MLGLNFFYVGPPKENIFSTTFYGLYFSNHITNYNLFHMLDLRGQFSCTASTPVFLTRGYPSCLYFCFNVSLNLIISTICQSTSRSCIQIRDDKISLPCLDLNPRPPWYQASTLPIELPCLGCLVLIDLHGH